MNLTEGNRQHQICPRSTRNPDPPRETSISVTSCHLFIATNHLSPLFLQLAAKSPSASTNDFYSTHLTSTTNRSFPTTDEIFCNLSNENLASGNR